MGKRPVKKSEAAEPSPGPALLVACVLIGLFTYRLTIPAHESPLLTELVLTIVFDAAMVVGLVVLRARLAAPTVRCRWSSPGRAISIFRFGRGKAAAPSRKVAAVMTIVATSGHRRVDSVSLVVPSAHGRVRRAHRSMTTLS
jgi:hypothetical protein